MKAVGVDAAQGKWLAVVLDDGQFYEAKLAREAATLAAAWPDAAAVGVDIPIGLAERPWREADLAAREFVEARRSSVFATFPQDVLVAPTYEDAKAICVAHGWPRPSIQSYGMRHRIIEVAELASRDKRIIEVHPEVSFRELAGQTLESKRTAAGGFQRRDALAKAGIVLPDLPYPLDDVLDAAVAAWSATRYARGDALPLPPGHQERIGAIWR